LAKVKEAAADLGPSAEVVVWTPEGITWDVAVVRLEDAKDNVSRLGILGAAGHPDPKVVGSIRPAATPWFPIEAAPLHRLVLLSSQSQFGTGFFTSEGSKVKAIEHGWKRYAVVTLEMGPPDEGDQSRHDSPKPGSETEG